MRSRRAADNPTKRQNAAALTRRWLANVLDALSHNPLILLDPLADRHTIAPISHPPPLDVSTRPRPTCLYTAGPPPPQHRLLRPSGPPAHLLSLIVVWHAWGPGCARARLLGPVSTIRNHQFSL